MVPGGKAGKMPVPMGESGTKWSCAADSTSGWCPTALLGGADARSQQRKEVPSGSRRSGRGCAGLADGDRRVCPCTIYTTSFRAVRKRRASDPGKHSLGRGPVSRGVTMLPMISFRIPRRGALTLKKGDDTIDPWKKRGKGGEWGNERESRRSGMRAEGI